jgi:hypothetical protein
VGVRHVLACVMGGGMALAWPSCSTGSGTGHAFGGGGGAEEGQCGPLKSQNRAVVGVFGRDAGQNGTLGAGSMAAFWRFHLDGTTAELPCSGRPGDVRATRARTTWWELSCRTP